MLSSLDLALKSKPVQSTSQSGYKRQRLGVPCPTFAARPCITRYKQLRQRPLTQAEPSKLPDVTKDIDAIYEDDDVLELPTLRHRLTQRDSPFVVDNNKGGGFVGDRDIVRLKVVQYEDGGEHAIGRFPEKSNAERCHSGLVTHDGGTCVPLPQWAIRSGPRRNIYYNPAEVTAAIVTCGGLCPGLNDVVQNIVYTLRDYGVPADQIYGIKFGLRGFYDRNSKPVVLDEAAVDNIQLRGGTVLGTSRGGADIPEIVKRLALWGVNHLYVIGGNGGNAAANAIEVECEKQGHLCSVVGVPKSIDNDILLIDRCFGFDTAVGESIPSLLAAATEARSAHMGIGLVKLMGRSSGFIAMNASMASGVVDVCLIPEVPFTMPKLLDYVREVVTKQGHCVVCVAEGAGQDIVESEVEEHDASGNPILKDIGAYLRDTFKREIKGSDCKYIDPSYMIRSVPTSPVDRIYCKVLGQGAVHGAFAGYTGFTIGLVNTHYVMLPIPTIIQAPRTVDPRGRQWNRLKTAINQPDMV